MNSSTVPIEHAGPLTGSQRTVARKRSRLKTIAFVGIGVAILAGAAYVSLDASPTASRVRSQIESLKDKVVGPTVPVKAAPDAPSEPPHPWNGLVKVSDDERAAIGFRIMTVTPQTKPIMLELPGKTDYDQNTLNKIRPRFDDALITRVFVSVGQPVKKGDALYELSSMDLATAKKECRNKYVQWDHDLKYLNSREPLAKEGRITQRDWVDTQNDEKKSRFDYLNARQILATYQITSEQIDKLLEGLGDDQKKALQADDNMQDDSHLTVTSRYDGIVVERDVVPGNYYDTKDVLLTISPMDNLWVWGDVFESDQDKVHIGQKWNILFQYTNEQYEGKVESIANGIDPETRTLRIRASIPNPGKNLVARMLVRATLQIKPLPSDTVIPRNAVVVINGNYYAFIEQIVDGKPSDLFERRKLEIEQEDHDIVTVKNGLKPGDRVVSNGSLILSQMYEDQSTVDSGMPRP